jgi:hypothetical protein
MVGMTTVTKMCSTKAVENSHWLKKLLTTFKKKLITNKNFFVSLGMSYTWEGFY